MYHWIEDKGFLGRMRSLCSGIVNELVQSINAEKQLHVRAYMVGSGAKNIEAQNENLPIDLDYNLEILQSPGFDNNDCREIKEYIRKAFNVVLSNNGWSDCEDSTSALQTEKRHFTSGNSTEFSIDLAIVTSDNQGNWLRLIHEKTGFTYYDKYFWNQAPDSKGLDEKVRKLKAAGKWFDVRETYLTKKNMYLQRSFRGEHRPSFIIYIEAVNEEYAKLPKQVKSVTPKANKNKAEKKVKTVPAESKNASPVVSSKILFNNEIQQRLAKSKQYDNGIISAVASLCGQNFDRKKSKKQIHIELVQKYGQKQGDAIYQRIASALK